MKKLLFLISLIFVFSGYTFAITQTVNETNGVNYGYLKNVYIKWTTYYVSIDYVQLYMWYEAALARAEDGVIFGDLAINFNQNYPAKYYILQSNGEKLANKVIRKKINTYLVKIGKKGREKLIAKLNNYDWSNPSELFNTMTEIERMIAWPSFEPATWWSAKYIRNTNTQIRNIPFSPTAEISVEWNSMTLPELVTRSQMPSQNLVKVFLKKGKIEWFRIDQITWTINNITKEMGLITNVYIDKNWNKKLDIDYIKIWWSNECHWGVTCIINQDPQLRTFTISNNVEIIMQTLSHITGGNFNNDQSISFDYFIQKFNDTNSYDEYPHNYMYLKTIPYRITINKNIIIKIEEQYLS